MIRRVTWLKKNLVKERLGRNKVLFSFQQSQTTNGQIATAGFPIISMPGRQIFSFLLTSGSIENQTDSNFFLFPHLARFVACSFVSHPCFCLKGSVGLTIGLTIGEAESKGADIAISFSRCSLWKMLTIFRRCMTIKEDFQVFSSSRYLFYATK